MLSRLSMDSLVLEALEIIISEAVLPSGECQEKLLHLIADGYSDNIDGNPLVHEVEKKTVLHELIKSGMADTLSELLSKFPVDLNSDALISQQDISALAWTLSKEKAKDDPDVRNKPIIYSSELTPLILACYAGDKNMVQVLIRAGAEYKTSMNLLSKSISDSCQKNPVAMVIAMDKRDCFEVFLNNDLLEIVDLNALLKILLINKAVQCLECVSSHVSSGPKNDTELLRLAERNGMRCIRALLRMGFSYTQMHASMNSDALEKYYLRVGLQHYHGRKQFEASCAEFTDLFLTGGGEFESVTLLEERHIRALMMRLCKFYARKLFPWMCNDTDKKVKSVYADIRATLSKLGCHPRFTFISRKMHDKFCIPYLTYIAYKVSRQHIQQSWEHIIEFLELINTLYAYNLPVRFCDCSKIVTMQIIQFERPRTEGSLTRSLCKIYPNLIELKISVLRNQLCGFADIDKKRTIVNSWLRMMTYISRHWIINAMGFVNNMILLNAILHMVSSHGIWLQDLPVNRNFYGHTPGRCSFLQHITRDMSTSIQAFCSAHSHRDFFKFMMLFTVQWVNLEDEIKHDLQESRILSSAYTSIFIESVHELRRKNPSNRLDRGIIFCQFILSQIPHGYRQKFMRKMNIRQIYLELTADDPNLVGLKRCIDSLCEVDTLYNMCLLRCRSSLMSPPAILLESSESDTSTTVGFLNVWNADSLNVSPFTAEEMTLCFTHNSPLQQNVNMLTIPRGLKMDIIGIYQLKDTLKSME